MKTGSYNSREVAQESQTDVNQKINSASSLTSQLTMLAWSDLDENP